MRLRWSSCQRPPGFVVGTARASTQSYLVTSTSSGSRTASTMDGSDSAHANDGSGHCATLRTDRFVSNDARWPKRCKRSDAQPANRTRPVEKDAGVVDNSPGPDRYNLQVVQLVDDAKALATEVEDTDRFEQWWHSLTEDEQDHIAASVQLALQLRPIAGPSSSGNHLEEPPPEHEGTPTWQHPNAVRLRPTPNCDPARRWRQVR